MFPKRQQEEKAHVCPRQKLVKWFLQAATDSPPWLLLLYHQPRHSGLPSPENEWRRNHTALGRIQTSSMERSKPSSPVALAGGDAALSKYFHHLLLLPTRPPGLAHLSEALFLPHSKVQEHEVPRRPGCLYHVEHRSLRVASHLSPDSFSPRS